MGDSRELKLEGGVAGQKLGQPGRQRAVEVGGINEGIEQRDVGRDSGRPGRRVGAADRLQFAGQLERDDQGGGRCTRGSRRGLRASGGCRRQIGLGGSEAIELGPQARPDGLVMVEKGDLEGVPVDGP
jgi:hypothetical protein